MFSLIPSISVRPDPESPSVVQHGLRRSKRTRLPRLQSHLGQKALYEVDNDGSKQIRVNINKSNTSVNITKDRILVGASEVVLKDPRLKKYRVMDTVVAAEKEQETKCEQANSYNLNLERNLTLFRPEKTVQECETEAP